MELKLFVIASLLAIFVAAVDRGHQQDDPAPKSPPPKKDDVVERICKSDPDFMFCKQYMRGEMGEASMVPFPHLSKPKEGEKKRFLIIKNEFYPNGTVKIPENITLDAKNEKELEQIKTVNHKPFQPENNWGFGEAPPLKPGADLLPEPTTRKNLTFVEAQQEQSNNQTENVENENFDFELPKPAEEPEIKLPSKLPDTHPVPNEQTGLLSGVGNVNVGYGVGVPVPGSPDGVSVGARVGVGFGGSGPAWKIPYFFNNQGEYQSLNDYDGDKRNIVPDRAIKYYRYQVLQARAQARQQSELINAGELSGITR
uniref:Uncharacterized protein n=1 Tax=Panagrolaimus davidi TaxID=227884 RepID=A0A914QPU0_9BILA